VGKKGSGGKKGEKRAQSSQDHSDGSQKKQRKDPREMLQALTVDNGKEPNKKEASQYIRRALNWALDPGVDWVGSDRRQKRPGWVAACKQFPLLSEYYNKTSFVNNMKSLRAAQDAGVPFDVDSVIIGSGRKPGTSHKEKKTLAAGRTSSTYWGGREGTGCTKTRDVSGSSAPDKATRKKPGKKNQS